MCRTSGNEHIALSGSSDAPSSKPPPPNHSWISALGDGSGCHPCGGQWQGYQISGIISHAGTGYVGNPKYLCTALLSPLSSSSFNPINIKVVVVGLETITKVGANSAFAKVVATH